MSLPALDAGKGPTKSIAHDENGNDGTDEKDSTPSLKCVELLAPAHVTQLRTK
jgi:hypothetical protein